MSIWDKLKEDLNSADVNSIKHVIETIITELEHNNLVSWILPITADVQHIVPVVEEVATDTEAVADSVNEVAQAVAPAPVVAPVEATANFPETPQATTNAPAPNVNNPAPVPTPPIPVITGEVVGYPGPIVDANGVQVLIENPDGTMSLNPAATPGHVTQSEIAQKVDHAPESALTPPEGA